MRNEPRTDDAGLPPGEAGRDGLDLAIDNAVRDLMAVDAGPSFAARVLARTARHPSRWRPWAAGVGLAAAAGAAMVVAVVLWPPAETARPPAAAVRGTTAQPTLAPPAASSMAPEAPAVVAAVTPPRAPRAAAADRTRPAYPSGFAPDPIGTEHLRVEIPPLARLDPIGIEPLTAAPIEPAAITIVPLEAIPAIGTAPLSPPVERD